MSASVSVTFSPYGEHEGQQITEFTLKNTNGLEISLLNYGAILASVISPDRDGRRSDIVLGYDSMEGWAENPGYFGATVGRFANRIANGQFTLDGETYQLALNNDPSGIPCSLHGGDSGFDKKVWDFKTQSDQDHASVTFTVVSPDGDEGYPGELTAEVTYTLTTDNQLIWDARAVTKAPTIINLINHTYWNLSGDLTSPIDDHLLYLESNSYLQATAGMIPTGRVAKIEYTPLDFTEPKPMGQDIDAPFQALTEAQGYDQAFLLDNGGRTELAARVTHPDSGRTLEISTNQPAVHFYSGNFIPTEPAGRNGQSYTPRCGFCLETENYPDAPNNPNAPSPVLRPGDTYHHQMVCRFSW